MILFSFIIPVYNVEKFLVECLDSVINQTYKNWEAILIDDGSKDCSAKICDKYASNEERIKVYHTKNKGSLIARRYGISQANGQYLLFLDSDDIVDNKLLEKVNEIILTTKSDLINFRFRYFGKRFVIKKDSPIVYKNGTIISDGQVEREQLWKKIISGNELNNLCIKAVNRNIIDWYADYQQYNFMKSGTDFIQSIALIDNAKKIFFSDKILYYYRYNASGISSLKTKTVDNNSLKLHMKTREVILNHRLYYLKKNEYDTKENLQLLYKYNFISKIQQITEWISNIKGINKRKDIIQYALNEKALDEGKKYLTPKDFSGVYKILYMQYIANSNSLYLTLVIRSEYMKIISGVSLILGRILTT